MDLTNYIESKKREFEEKWDCDIDLLEYEEIHSNFTLKIINNDKNDK